MCNDDCIMEACLRICGKCGDSLIIFETKVIDGVVIYVLALSKESSDNLLYSSYVRPSLMSFFLITDLTFRVITSKNMFWGVMLICK